MLMAIVLLTVIGWLYLDQAAMIRESEMDIEVLERKRVHLMQDHRIIQWQIAESQSAERVLGYAGPLNLHDPAHIDTLDVPLVAIPPDMNTNAQNVAVESQEGSKNASWVVTAALWLEMLVSPQSMGD